MYPTGAWIPHFIGRHPLRDWAEAAGSLTRKLQAVSSQFNVVLLRQGPQEPFHDQRKVCRLPQHGRAMTREVLLRDGQTSLVYAHSVTALSALSGAWHHLNGLGNRPLGEALFTDPLVQRQPLHHCKINRQHPLYQRAKSQATGVQDWPTQLLARRSAFMRDNTPLLVTEVFLPALMQR